MTAFADTESGVARANELYWSSGKSVNQIAEELDLSKGALYGMIRPQPTGRACPRCGAEVHYSNRTAKERGRLDCGTCDWDGSGDETVELDQPALPELPTPPVPPRVLAGTEPESRLRVMAGGALIGAAVGLALVIWARRR